MDPFVHTSLNTLEDNIERYLFGKSRDYCSLKCDLLKEKSTGAYLVRILLPGIELKDVAVNGEDSTLFVEFVQDGKKSSYKIHLPRDVDFAQEVKATLQNGILVVKVPCTEKKRIEIKVE